MIDKVYEFWYNDCIHESAGACISLHRTQKGAEMAMEFHKNERLKKWNETKKWRKEHYGENYKLIESFSKFGDDEAWGVEEREILE